MILHIHLAKWYLRPTVATQHKYQEIDYVGVVKAVYHTPEKYKEYSFLCFTLVKY